MAADYWTSTQRMNWQFTRESLQENRKKLAISEKKMIEKGEVSNYPVKYDLHMKIYLHCLLIKLGRKLNIRQIALATSEVYLARFLTRTSIKEINVYLLVTTCIYLSCKIEESPQHIRTIVAEARNLWPEYIPHDATHIAEFEFYLIEELDSYLILHHPYNALFSINRIFLEDDSLGLRLTPEELQNCWSVINDSYVSDLHLLYPPHVIALAALYITIIIEINSGFMGMNVGMMNIGMGIGMGGMMLNSPSDVGLNNSENELTENNDIDRAEKFVSFLGLCNVDIDEVVDSIQEMVTIYSMWETYDEASVKKCLQTIILGR